MRKKNKHTIGHCSFSSRVTTPEKRSKDTQNNYPFLRLHHLLDKIRRLNGRAFMWNCSCFYLYRAARRAKPKPPLKGCEHCILVYLKCFTVYV